MAKSYKYPTKKSPNNNLSPSTSPIILNNKPIYQNNSQTKPTNTYNTKSVFSNINNEKTNSNNKVLDISLPHSTNNIDPSNYNNNSNYLLTNNSQNRLNQSNLKKDIEISINNNKKEEEEKNQKNTIPVPKIKIEIPKIEENPIITNPQNGFGIRRITEDEYYIGNFENGKAEGIGKYIP